MREETARPALTRKGLETRGRIVAAAADLVLQRGVAGTTVEAVQAAAGVSASQLYHYFADKDELLRAVVAHQAERIVSGQLAARLDSFASLRAWRDLVVALQSGLDGKGGCPLGSLGSQLAETDDEARVDVAAGFDRWEAAIGDGLRAMQANGQLRSDADPAALAAATLAAVQGGLLLTQVRRDTAPLAAAMDAMITLIGMYAVAAPAEA